MNKYIQGCIIALLLSVFGLSAVADDRRGGADSEKEVPLNRVPAHVLEAAKTVKRGMFIQRVTFELEKDIHFYYIHGSLYGDQLKIAVRDDGEIMDVSSSKNDR
jgi:hypothetical protein